MKRKVEFFASQPGFQEEKYAYNLPYDKIPQSQFQTGQRGCVHQQYKVILDFKNPKHSSQHTSKKFKKFTRRPSNTDGMTKNKAAASSLP